MALSSKNRLKKRKDFDIVFRRGKAIKGRFLLTKYTYQSGMSPRIGFVVSTKVARLAVTRNRIRRFLAGHIKSHLNKIDKDAIILVLKLPDKKLEKVLLSQEITHILGYLINTDGKNTS